MAAISVHIGLNEVDPNHYSDRAGRPWNGILAACENDARCMAELATSQGIRALQPILSRAATSSVVCEAIGDAAPKLHSGDLFMLTYSGHGGQVENKNADDDPEEDNLDETWCLYDRQLIDDELNALYAQFEPGVRIVVFSDSCHSGTVTRGAYGGDTEPGTRVKQPPDDVVIGTEEAHAVLYRDVQRGLPKSRLAVPRASVVLLSGCQDHQFSRDGDANGAFTGALLDAWKNEPSRASLRALHAATCERIPARYNQTPNYFVLNNDIAGPALRP